MKRRFPGVHQATQPAEVPDGLYLVRIHRAQYRWHARKAFYAVIEPKQLADSLISGRIYCTEKALWKLSWFLRDFGYDSELLGRNELDTIPLLKIRGVVKITRTIMNGTSLLNLTHGRWEELSVSGAAAGSEVG